MKLHPTTTQQYQTVTGYEVDWVEINAVRFDQSLVVLPEQAPSPWPVTDFDALQASDFAAIEALGGSAADVVRTRMYVADTADMDEVGRAHGELFGDIRPAATMIAGIKFINPAMLVEIEVDSYKI